jgi:hypothetical protein
VSAAGHDEERRRVDVKEAETAEVVVALAGAALAAPGPAQRAGPMKRQVPVWAWVSLGVGSASMVTSVAFALDAVIARSELTELCRGEVPCNLPAAELVYAQGLVDRYRRDDTATVVFGVAGVVGVAAGVVGIVLAPKVPASRSVSAAPWFGPGTGGVVMTGKF